ncbi:MAG: hypothetical protein WA510_28595, partial [Acidobacteriaceae bacterium]
MKGGASARPFELKIGFHPALTAILGGAAFEESSPQPTKPDADETSKFPAGNGTASRPQNCHLDRSGE